MTREPDVPLLVIASGSQIKLEFETLKANISRRSFTYRLNGFMLDSRAGLNLGEGGIKFRGLLYSHLVEFSLKLYYMALTEIDFQISCFHGPLNERFPTWALESQILIAS